MSARQIRVRTAYKLGLLDGAASLFNLAGRDRPAPPFIRRKPGTLAGDMSELKRDSDRLLRAGR
jgi:hypothetical protein